MRKMGGSNGAIDYCSGMERRRTSEEQPVNETSQTGADASSKQKFAALSVLVGRAYSTFSPIADSRPTLAHVG